MQQEVGDVKGRRTHTGGGVVESVGEDGQRTVVGLDTLQPVPVRTAERGERRVPGADGRIRGDEHGVVGDEGAAQGRQVDADGEDRDEKEGRAGSSRVRPDGHLPASLAGLPTLR